LILSCPSLFRLQLDNNHMRWTVFNSLRRNNSHKLTILKFKSHHCLSILKINKCITRLIKRLSRSSTLL
jgi:hypothetical protein